MCRRADVSTCEIHTSPIGAAQFPVPKLKILIIFNAGTGKAVMREGSGRFVCVSRSLAGKQHYFEVNAFQPWASSG